MTSCVTRNGGIAPARTIRAVLALLALCAVGVATAQTYNYTGPVTALPDNTPAGLNFTINVTHTDLITDLNFAMPNTGAGDGNCSATIGDVDSGIDHTWVGDIIIRITSPAATTVTIVDRMGFTGTGFGTDAENFCNTVIDDEGAGGPIESAAATAEPFSGSFTPNNPLSAFDGQNPQGVWTINISDNAASDLGSVRALALTFAPPAGTAQVSAGNASVTEGDPPGTVTLLMPITLDAPPLADVTVDYTTSSGSATEGVDFDDATGSVTFSSALAETSKTVSVTVNNDEIAEDDETLTLTLTGVSAGPGAIVDATGTGTITNDDLPTSLFFDDAETAGVFNFESEWHRESSSGCTSPLDGFHSATNAYVFNTEALCAYNADAVGSATMAAGVALPAATLGLELSFWDWFETTDATFDFGFVEISDDAGASWDLLGSFTNDDTVWDQESFDITSYAGSTVIVRFRFAADFLFEGRGWYVDDISITSIDLPAGTSAVSVADASVPGDNAGNPTMDFTVTIAPAAFGAGSITFSTASGSATEGVDFTDSGSTVPFNSGDTSVVLSVPITADTAVEGGETFTLTIDSFTGPVALLVDEATGLIGEDDLVVGSGFAVGVDASVEELVAFELADPSNMFTLGVANVNGGFLLGGDFVGGDFTKFYTSNIDDVIPANLNTITQHDIGGGPFTVLGQVTGLGPGEGINGFTYDDTTGNTYIAASDGTNPANLYTLNIGTLAATLVGNMGAAAGALPLCMAASPADNNLYALNLVSNGIVRIDKSTGAATAVGAVGYDANFGQDGDFNDLTETYHLATFNNTSFQAELRTVDTSTGASTLIGAIGVPGDTQISCFGILAEAAPVGTSLLTVADDLVAGDNPGEPNAVFRLDFNPATTGPVDISFNTVNGTAAAPGDFQAESGTATIPTGSTIYNLLVQIAPDTDVEGIESFSMNVAITSGPAIVSDGTGVASIAEDDLAANMGYAYGLEVFGLQEAVLVDLDTPSVFLPMGPIDTAGLPLGGDFINDDFSSFYTLDVTTFALNVYDVENGGFTTIATLTPSGAFVPVGLTWDESTNTAFTIMDDGTATPQLHSVDLGTGVTTLVATLTGLPTGVGVGLSADPAGNLFCYGLDPDSLFSINKVTGTTTAVGPLGVDLNFAQDADFNDNDGTYYAASFNNTDGEAQLLTIDTATGAATLVGGLGADPANTEISAFGVVAQVGSAAAESWNLFE